MNSAVHDNVNLSCGYFCDNFCANFCDNFCDNFYDNFCDNFCDDFDSQQFKTENTIITETYHLTEDVIDILLCIVSDCMYLDSFEYNNTSIFEVNIDVHKNADVVKSLFDDIINLMLILLSRQFVTGSICKIKNISLCEPCVEKPIVNRDREVLDSPPGSQVINDSCMNDYENTVIFF